MAVHRGELTADVPMFPSPKSQSSRTLPYQDPFSGEFGWCQGVCSVHSGSSSGPRGHHPRAEDEQGKRAQDGEQREAQHPPGVRGMCHPVFTALAVVSVSSLQPTWDPS